MNFEIRINLANKKREIEINLTLLLMVPWTGFEPMTYCLEGSCSIQLSYQGILIAKLRCKSINQISKNKLQFKNLMNI